MDLGERISPSSASDLRKPLVEPLSESRTKLADFFSTLLTIVANIPPEGTTQRTRGASVLLLEWEWFGSPAVERQVDLVVERIVAALLDVVHDANG